MNPRRKKVITGLVAACLVSVICLASAWYYYLGKVHRHCIKVAGSAFQEYAMDHDGALPYDTNGFGDALLLLVKGGYLPGVAWICGPGDDGHVLSNALAHGLHVPEEQCSRVYIQGLRNTDNPQICILFDRHSVRGGDHFYGRGKRVREVCLLDGAMESILDARWPEFCREQIKLLLAAGFKREKALQYYSDALPALTNLQDIVMAEARFQQALTDLKPELPNALKSATLITKAKVLHVDGTVEASTNQNEVSTGQGWRAALVKTVEVLKGDRAPEILWVHNEAVRDGPSWCWPVAATNGEESILLLERADDLSRWCQTNVYSVLRGFEVK